MDVEAGRSGTLVRVASLGDASGDGECTWLAVVTCGDVASRVWAMTALDCCFRV
jgi:hypothetical protein